MQIKNVNLKKIYTTKHTTERNKTHLSAGSQLVIMMTFSQEKMRNGSPYQYM